MSDESHANDASPSPTPPAKPEKRPGYIWQTEFVSKKTGKLVKGHWRKDSKAKAKAKRGRPRKSERPQFTGKVHAFYVMERLDLPMTYLTVLKRDAALSEQAIIEKCLYAITLAQKFASRFTKTED